MDWGATVDQVHYHLELPEQYSVEWAKYCTWHYGGNGDSILVFQIEKKSLIMKLLLLFVRAKKEYTPKQIHLWCKCMIHWGAGGGGGGWTN